MKRRATSASLTLPPMLVAFWRHRLIDKAANEEAALPMPIMICLQRRYQGNEEEEEVWTGGERKRDKMKRRPRHS